MLHRTLWLSVIAAVSVVLGAGPSQEDPAKKTPKYKGDAACKMCHSKKEKGEPHVKWSASTHAKAFGTLAGDAAKKICADKKLGADPQKEKECLACHVTAYGVDAKLVDAKFKPENGVQCEACHGPGEFHITNRVKEASLKKVIARGGLKDEIKLPTEETCKGCHNEKSPSFKDFKYEERLKAIEHKDPTRDK